MIDILIPMKLVSIRCPNKNLTLFPFVINLLNEYKDSIVILSEDDECIELANRYGLRSWKFPSKYSSDLNICYQYARQHNIDYFFMFPLTQPFKDLSYIGIAQSFVNDDYDIICSSIHVSDRRLFYVKDNEFLVNNTERKGCLCEEYEMIDGSMYLIKTNFLSQCIINNEIDNYLFWNTSKIKTIMCNHPFFDVDTLNDMERFNFLTRYFHRLATIKTGRSN